MYTPIILLLVLALWANKCDSRAKIVDLSTIEVPSDEFYYFGFGSNLLAKRIHIQNPTARILGPAVLEDYRLDFVTLPFVRWHGAAATIVPTSGYRTWGTLWAMNVTDLPNIDDQEGVHLNLYKPVSIQVKMDKTLPARAYVMVKQPVDNFHELNPVPLDRQPSKTYLKVMVKGAIESGLPNEYVNWLKGLKHNNQTVQTFEDQLELHDVVLKD